MSDRNPLHTDYMITAIAPNAKECVLPALRRALRGRMKNRMRKLVHAAIAHGNERLKVGAFGCGVFGNVPEVVAMVEKELMVDNRLRFHFASALNPVTSARRSNSAYHAFRRVLEPRAHDSGELRHE
jgi:uncharacterized protein (TIGR02452 family)